MKVMRFTRKNFGSVAAKAHFLNRLPQEVCLSVRLKLIYGLISQAFAATEPKFLR